MDWQTSRPTGLEQAIADFKAALPGWWFTVGECQVSADASCGPTREAPDHLALIPFACALGGWLNRHVAAPDSSIYMSAIWPVVLIYAAFHIAFSGGINPDD